MILGAVFLLLMAVLGVAYFVVTGIAAYKGTWRIWAAGVGVPVQFGKHNYTGFVGLYLLPVFAAVLLLVVLGQAGVPGAAEGNGWLFVLPVAVPAVLCFFRLPRFLLPQWYKDWLDRGANTKELTTGEFDSPFTWLRRTPRADQRK